MSDVMEIPLSNGGVALVDRADLPLVIGYRWWGQRMPSGACYARTGGGGRGKKLPTTYMHRLILQTPSGFDTDHVNGDGLDNRRANLRTATRAQNEGNKWKPRRPDGKPHSSRFKGVSWDRCRGKWVAGIKVNQRRRFLGYFTSETAAARAYDAAAIEVFGEFAFINFPLGESDPRRAS